MKQIPHAKVIIIGAGIAGLTAGIYALDNGFDVSIYEKHTVVGGECTGWYRKGQYIEGCAHWIVGTNPKSELFPLYRHIGAFDENTKIYPTEYTSVYELNDGRHFTFYSDLDKLYQEAITFFPEDKKAISHFIRKVKIYQHAKVPVNKPLDLMTPFELIPYGISLLPMARTYAKYTKVSITEYCKRFKNPELGSMIMRFLSENFNIHSFFYVCQAASKGNDGMVEGGSLKMMNRVKEKFLSKGGHLYLNTPVEEILTEGKKVTGIRLKDNQVVNADYVIAACDVHHTIYTLLKGKYLDPYYEERFNDKEGKYPIRSSIQISYRTKKDVSSFPKMMDYKCDVTYLRENVDHFSVRNFSFDPTLKKDGYTLLTVLLMTKEQDYKYLKSLPKEEYQKKKQEIGLLFQKEIEAKMDLKEDEIELLDVTTPLTYERYANAYEGSYMSFITTKFAKGLMRKSAYQGLDNFQITGQWLMSPGGIPIALFTGKHAAYRLCHMNHQKFINKEAEDVKK